MVWNGEEAREALAESRRAGGQCGAKLRLCSGSVCKLYPEAAAADMAPCRNGGFVGSIPNKSGGSGWHRTSNPSEWVQRGQKGLETMQTGSTSRGEPTVFKKYQGMGVVGRSRVLLGRVEIVQVCGGGEGREMHHLPPSSCCISCPIS